MWFIHFCVVKEMIFFFHFIESKRTPTTETANKQKNEKTFMTKQFVTHTMLFYICNLQFCTHTLYNAIILFIQYIIYDKKRTKATLAVVMWGNRGISLWSKEWPFCLHFPIENRVHFILFVCYLFWIAFFVFMSIRGFLMLLYIHK